MANNSAVKAGEIVLNYVYKLIYDLYFIKRICLILCLLNWLGWSSCGADSRY